MKSKNKRSRRFHLLQYLALPAAVVLLLVVYFAASQTSSTGVRQLLPDGIEVRRILKSPVENLFAVFSQGKISLWDSERQLMRDLEQPEDVDCSTLTWSPDGKMLAAWGNGITILWDVATGKVAQILPGDYVYQFGDDCGSFADRAFSPDSTRLAFTYEDTDGLALWDIASGQVTHRLKDSGGLLEVTFSPDGKYIGAVTSYGRAMVWEVATEALKYSAVDGRALSFSPDSTMVAVGIDTSPVKTIQVLDLSTFEPLVAYETPFSSYQLDWTPDNRSILFSLDYPFMMSEGYTNSGSVVQFDVSNQQVIRRYERICQVNSRYQPGENEILLSWDDFENPSWGSFLNTQTGEHFPVKFEGDKITRLPVSCDGLWLFELSPDGTRLATLKHDNRLSIWNIGVGEEIAVYTPEVKMPPYSINNLQWLDDQSLLFRSRGRVLVWNVPELGG